jgi:Glycosyltransferase family 87
MIQSSRAVVPAAAAAGAVLLAGVLYTFGYRDQYFALLGYWGAAPFRFPFLDMNAVTSAVECHRLGFDVYVRNPCDALNRVHGYSPVWLWLSILPISTAWDTALGLATVVLFIVALPFLPPGRGWWQTAVITLGTVSSVVMFALERANVDVLIFLLAMLAVALSRRNMPLRMLGYAVALFAGMLKFYPITLLILAVRERLGVFIAVGLVACGVIVLWFVLDSGEILRGMANIPTTQYFDEFVFGARDLPYGLAQTFGLPRPAGAGLLVVLLVGLVAAAAVMAACDDTAARLRRLTDAEATYLLVGCILLIGCFLAAQNILYRSIFFLFVLPGLTALVRSDGRRRLDGLYVGVTASIIVLMWNDTARTLVDGALRMLGVSTAPNDIAHFDIWLVREVMWWTVVVVLTAFLFRLVQGSRAARDAVALLSGRMA